MKPLKPGGATLENVFFTLFGPFLEMRRFHFRIFVVFYSISMKLATLLVCSMIYQYTNREAKSIKVT